MNTEVLRIDTIATHHAAIMRAAALLRAGRLVAFPTETVYGLGANALDPVAVRRIFTAKGRPASNPLIVHVADPTPPTNVAAQWPETAQRLAKRFWPGPLTIVVARRPEVPDEVTAGGSTVAVRCPDHPIARAIIAAAGVPIAAPSANRSTELSPTCAEHVLKSLADRIDMVIDGGPCTGGIESTVVDVTGDVVRLLRPGLISVPMLEEVIGTVTQCNAFGQGSEAVARSPGQMAKHYSPRTPLRLIDGCDLMDDVLEAVAAGKRVKMLPFFGPNAMPNEPAAYAAMLYARLHELDAQAVDLILVETPPDTPEWAGVRDRLTRAASAG